MTLSCPNHSPIRTILIALLVVGVHNFIKEGAVIAQLGKFANLSPTVLLKVRRIETRLLFYLDFFYAENFIYICTQ